MRRLIAFFMCMFATPLVSHPHIFVDTALKLEIDAAGQLTGVEVHWKYDELYTLLILEDMGLDRDYDGLLNDDELRKLSGFDQKWVDGFNGDLAVRSGSKDLVLGGPENRGVSVVGGQITSVHYRNIAPVLAEGLVIKAFDPTYYTAYDLSLGVTVAAPCRVQVIDPDLDAAAVALQAALADVPPDAVDYPEMGETFAQEVRVSCGG